MKTLETSLSSQNMHGDLLIVKKSVLCRFPSENMVTDESDTEAFTRLRAKKRQKNASILKVMMHLLSLYVYTVYLHGYLKLICIQTLLYNQNCFSLQQNAVN